MTDRAETEGREGWTAHAVLARMAGLPPHLSPDAERTVIEAVTPDAIAPFLKFERLNDEAVAATDAWAKAQGARGFYPPHRGGFERLEVDVLSFPDDRMPKVDKKVWLKAYRSYLPERGYEARRLGTKHPRAKELRVELAALPQFPSWNLVLAPLGLFTTLRNADGSGFSTVGSRGSSLQHAIIFSCAGRHFVDFPNWNYDIGEKARYAIEHPPVRGEHDFAESRFDYKGDPIAWRPPQGWTFSTRAEMELVRAEENAQRTRAALARAVQP